MIFLFENWTNYRSTSSLFSCSPIANVDVFCLNLPSMWYFLSSPLYCIFCNFPSIMGFCMRHKIWSFPLFYHRQLFFNSSDSRHVHPPLKLSKQTMYYGSFDKRSKSNFFILKFRKVISFESLGSSSLISLFPWLGSQILIFTHQSTWMN